MGHPDLWEGDPSAVPYLPQKRGQIWGTQICGKCRGWIGRFAMSSDMGLISGIVLALALIVFTFWPEKNSAVQREKTRLDFLEELKEQIYLNLRDLNFEYQAGKYPQEDYAVQRAILENEAAAVLSEMDALSGRALG